MTIAKLEESLGRAWKAILLLAAAFGAAFLFFLVRIDDRFDRVDGPVHDLTTNVAVQASTLNGIEKSLDRIEGKLDRNDQPETSARAGEAGTVRDGTGSGKRP